MRDRLKFLWKQSWDENAINAVGVLNYHPPLFADLVKNYIEDKNKHYVVYGVTTWLNSNLAERSRELERELNRLRCEREDLEEQVRKRKRRRRLHNPGRVSDDETSETEGETETEDGTD